MGSSSSSNVVDSTTSALLNVVNSTTQQCVSPLSQTQVASITAKGGSIVNIGTIDWSQVVSVKSNCALSASTTNNLSQSLTQTAAQTATSSNSALGLDLGSQAANNIVKYTTNLATTIDNAYVAQCGNLVNQVQAVNFNATDGSVINAGSLNWKQTQDSVISCIQNNTDVNNATQNLQQAVNQVAKTSVSGTFFLILFIIIGIIVVIIIGAVVFYVIKSQKQNQGAPGGGGGLAKTAMKATPQGRVASLATKAV